VAWLEWNDPHGWMIRQQRRVYFVKNRFLLVRDRFLFTQDLQAAVGTVWHGEDVRPEHGANWYDLYWREPRGLNWKFKNPERYALLYFVPRVGREIAAWKESAYAPKYTSPPWVLYQKGCGEAKATQAVWFDTLLLPHGNELTPPKAAAQVSVLYDDGANVALQVRSGDETWIVVDNPGAKTITARGLATDAAYLIACAKPKTPDYLVVTNATKVKVGATNQNWPTPTTTEIGK
jgi:hypothetical protein